MTRLLIALLRQIVREGSLEVECANGRRVTIGDGTGQPLGIRFEDRAAERRLLLNPALAFGELYTDRRITVTKGTIYNVIELISKNLALQHPSAIAATRARIRKSLRPLKRSNTAQRSKQNVAHHYDIDRRFYDLFLDTDRQYSCGYFENSKQDLEKAQLAKKRHIAAKLLVEPGHRVLDIGSGWGGLALYLAKNCGADVTGITLSEEQLAVSRRRIDEKELPSNVDFQLQDYRNISGDFERIVSVGMFEHVGVSHFDSFFRTISEHLTTDGVMLLHSIGRVDGPTQTNAWIEKYIFPGSYVPALSEVLPAIERAGLIVTDVEILRLHYANTLRLWRERFLARCAEAIALTDERFFRMWEFYLAACEAGFRYSGLMVFQIQLAKNIDTVPLTRDYIAEKESHLRLKDMSRLPLQVAAE